MKREWTSINSSKRRTMRVERRWAGDGFVYYRVYSDGAEEPTTRREGEKYEKASGETVRTVRA